MLLKTSKGEAEMTEEEEEVKKSMHGRGWFNTNVRGGEHQKLQNTAQILLTEKKCLIPSPLAHAPEAHFPFMHDCCQPFPERKKEERERR